MLQYNLAGSIVCTLTQHVGHDYKSKPIPYIFKKIFFSSSISDQGVEPRELLKTNPMIFYFDLFSIDEDKNNCSFLYQFKLRSKAQKT